jgi:SNF2 family DNA or RNA helicase
MGADYFYSGGVVSKRIDNESYYSLEIEDSYDYATNNSKIKVFDELHSISLKLVKSKLKAEINLRNNKIELTSINKIKDYFCDGEYWIPLNKGNLSEINALIHEVGLLDLGELTFSQKLYLSVHGKGLTPPLDDSEMSKLEEVSEQVIPNLSFGEPYNYQKDGYKWLRWLVSAGVGGLLGDEMGLGKTLQIIMLLESELENGNLPNLIVCPPSLLENWKREIKLFINRDAVIHQGVNRMLNKKHILETPIVIASYDAIRKDELLLNQINWNLIAADEAQYLKNYSSQRSISLKNIPKRTGIAVTGTPIENSLEDIWAITDFTAKGLLGERDWFLKTFNDDAFGANQLRELIKPILLRRKVVDVAQDLPSVTYKQVPLSPTFNFTKAYIEIRNEGLANKDAVFSIISKLRQLCSHTENLNSNYEILEHELKFEYLKNNFEELSNSKLKALLFAPFSNTIELVANWYKFNFPNNFIATLTGKTKIEDRQVIIDEFSSSNMPGLLILNPKAGGVGLNITAANHVFHFAPDWNPAVMDQASARSYRRGQKFPVTIHNMFYTNTIEEYIYEVLENKRNLANTALLDQDIVPTKEELLDALSKIPGYYE